MAVSVTTIRMSGLMVAGSGGSQAVPKVSQRIILAQASPKPPQTTEKTKISSNIVETTSKVRRSHNGAMSRRSVMRM